MAQAGSAFSFRRNRWIPVAILAVSAAGCAGGSWLESRSDAELPIDSPAHGYPTAIRPAVAVSPASISVTDRGPVTAISRNAIDLANAPAVLSPTAPQAAPPAPTTRADPPPTVVTPLAVVPSEFRIHAPQSPPSAAALLAPADLVQPQFQSVLPLLAAAASSADIGLAPVAQASAAQVASPAITPISPPSASSASEDRGQPANVEAAPSERMARIERARAELIASLESDIRRRRSENPNDDELPRLEQHLRLAYLSAGRLDDAVSTVESLDGSQQGGFKHLMFGLGVWLSPDEARRVPLRAAKVVQSLREATTDLAAGSKLTLPKLCFCERVDYFGWYTEFPRNEFQPKQQVILYAEIENFTAEHKSPTGYETELQGTYQIFDAGGQMIAERQLPLDKEVCRNFRRDYFLAYRIYMPDTIAPGRYRLELTIEDLKAHGYQGRKLGEGMLDFTIRP